MLCKNPYMQGVQAYGCGQCLPCRINRRRLWTHRMMLESLKHGESSFVTLTYAKEHLPKNATLVPKDTQLLLKRLRKHFSPFKLRYFLVGEYGDETHRPHYHMALFGVGAVLLAGSDGRGDPLKSLWGMGHVYAGTLTKDSAQYVAGYVTKKMTKKDDPRLGDRYPEFARMSLRPGIGATAMVDVARVLDSDVGMELIHKNGDVPMALSHGKSSMPLGRYLRRKLREEMGFVNPECPPARLATWGLEMRFLYEEALLDPKNASKGVKQVLIESNIQRVRNLESRTKIHSGGKTL